MGAEPDLTQLSMGHFGGAAFSPCRTYRYTLWRRWGPGDYAMFVGLNPSTADETTDDNTIKKCKKLARTWDYDALVMTNLFGYRTKDPAVLKEAAGAGVDPVGPNNDNHLTAMARDAGIVVAAWGCHGTLMGRDRDVVPLLGAYHVLKLTKGGHPHHPLYLRDDSVPVPHG